MASEALVSFPQLVSNIISYNSICSATTDTLFLYNSRIGGTLPSELGGLDLSEFLANNNQLTSSVPDELWKNEQMTLLRLDSNLLTGTLSSHIGNLIGLTDLFLSNNTLSGNLPVTMLRLTSLGTCWH